MPASAGDGARRIVETATVSLPLRLRSPAGQALQQAVLPFPATLLNEAMPWRVTLTLDDDLLAALDALSARRGYHNRSEAVRDILRDALNQDPPSPESRRGYAVLSYVYEHERELASRLVATQHHHHDLRRHAACTYQS